MSVCLLQVHDSVPRFVTIIQNVQMFIGLGIAHYALSQILVDRKRCDVSLSQASCGAIMYSIYVFLFLKFYLQKYKTPSQPKPTHEPKSNGTMINGRMANGASNGRMANGVSNGVSNGVTKRIGNGIGNGLMMNGSSNGVVMSNGVSSNGVAASNGLMKNGGPGSIREKAD